MKPGIYTSEFWLTVLVTVCATVALMTGDIDATIWLGALGITSTGYSISRGVAKNNPSVIVKTD